MDFTNHYLFPVNIFGHTIGFSQSMKATCIISLLLIIFAFVVRAKLNSFTDKPTGFQNFLELIVEMFDNFVGTTMGNKNRYFGNWFFTVFAFILLSNYSGLFFLRAPTSDLSTTLTLALTTFVLIHTMGIMSKGVGGYFKGFMEPFPFFLPIHLVGELARPVSLSFRLFGNILGGTIIMGMIYHLPFYFKIGIPAALHIYFDMFAGSMQAFIFTILSMTFIAEAMGGHEHE